MMELKIALAALVLGIASMVGVNIFDDMEWEGVATLCAVVVTICGVVFIMSIIGWIWSL